MKLNSLFVIWLLCLLSVSVAFADFYQWTDKNGVKHFTDDYSEVPEDQRSKLDVHKTIKSQTKKEESVPTENKEAVLPENETASSPENTITFESLNTMKAKIDSEYSVIVKKRDSLTVDEKNMDKKIYNEQVDQLNAEILEYEKKREVYEDLVKQYNKQTSSSK